MKKILLQLRLEATESQTLDEVTVSLGESVQLDNIKALKLYYSGTEARQDRSVYRFAPVKYISSNTPGATLEANPSYSIRKAEVRPTSNTITLAGNQKLFPGLNFFWVSVEMDASASLATTLTADIASVKVDGKPAPVIGTGKIRKLIAKVKVEV